MQPRHHAAKFGAHFFDGVLLLRVAQSGELLATGFVLFDPFARERAILNAREDFFHLHSCVIADHLRAASQIAVFGGVRDGIAHTRQSTLINEVHDELHFVQAFEIRDFRLVPSFHQSLESFFDQRRQATAKDRLLA